MSKQHRSWVVAAAMAVALVSAACGGGSAAGGVTGSVEVSGSSTVEPISAAVAERFVADNPNAQISVDGPGTGDGFELFCNGETDISDASRPIDEEEVALCEENGVEFIELKVGIDGLTVLTSPANDEVECLSFQDLYALVGPESEGVGVWSDANALGSEAGGSGDYPDAALEITAPGEESGTYDSFAEIVLEDIAVEERGQSEDGPFVRPDYQASPDDNVIIQGVSENETSLGWVGFAFYESNADAVKAIEVEASEGSGCVAPTKDTIRSGDYPIARDLYIYVDAAKAEAGSAVAAYVDLYLGDAWGLVEEVGYVALDEEARSTTTEAWENRTTGSQAQA